MASTEIYQTVGSTTENKIFTFSGWVKRSGLSFYQTLIQANGDPASANYIGAVQFTDSDQIRFIIYHASTLGEYITNAKYRDTSAWYHIVLSVDTTQATASNRVKLYVNGEEVTSFATETDPSQNQTLQFNTVDSVVNLGSRYSTSGSSQYFDGSMAHVNYIDGTAYDASYFGETDTASGIWKPKTQPSVTYGTNGFFLKFANSGSLGTDSSGNANNFTVSGTGTQTLDTPSNVFATLNPLQKYGGSLSNGNLTYVGTQDPDWIVATLGASAGKWYWEAQVNSGSSYILLGVTTTDTASAKQSASIGNDFIGFRNSDSFYNFGTLVTSSYSYADSDIFGFMLDLTAGECKFYQNDTLKQTITLPTDKGDIWIPVVGDTFDVTDGNYDLNFGNGYFGTTAVASGNADGDGYGIFEYTTKNGYALCTKNINTYG